ncbi:MAG: hypothetical protein JWO53_104 [Chlamydiia bacterium]|nr:hypothetical protein [Chlamydiia bacterium]
MSVVNNSSASSSSSSSFSSSSEQSGVPLRATARFIQYAKDRGFIKQPSLKSLPKVLQLKVLEYLVETNSETEEGKFKNYLQLFNNRSFFKTCKEFKKLEALFVTGNGNAISDALFAVHEYQLENDVLPIVEKDDLQSSNCMASIRYLNLSRRPGSHRFPLTTDDIKAIISRSPRLEKLTLDNCKIDLDDKGVFKELIQLKDCLKILSLNGIKLLDEHIK